jgi:glycosyltransferase involved in cell wall biosynthesis
VSYEAGADILADAIVTVCGSDTSAQFVFAGDGALRGELQDRIMHAGLGNRFRLIGDVPSGRFEQLLKACDFVVIPSRVQQGEELAQLALSFGKPALVTHQSGIRCIVHGENGLITYDNPGSFVWGIREMLGPLYGKLGGRHAQAA